MIELSIPAGNEYVRLMIDILNDDGANNELWAIDDIQIIAITQQRQAQQQLQANQYRLWIWSK
jgi:hypothetical protein